jgi:hypothetical protein
MEMTGMASAMMLGPLLGGFSIDVLGLGGAFAVPAVLLAGSVLVLSHASPGLPVAALPGTTQDESARGGIVLLRRNPTLIAIMAVTVIANLCCFDFIPFVPVIAKNLGAGAALAGVIGSAAGTMQLVAQPRSSPGRRDAAARRMSAVPRCACTAWRCCRSLPWWCSRCWHSARSASARRCSAHCRRRCRSLP